MGSVFDFPDGLDLNEALATDRLFRAAGLSRLATGALMRIGFVSLNAVREADWLEGDGAPGLKATLQRQPLCGPAVVAEIARWRAIPFNN